MKRYIETALNADEKIIYDAKVHWAIFIFPVIWTMGVIVGAFALASGMLVQIMIVGTSLIQTLHPILMIIYGLLIAFLVLQVPIYAIIYYFNSDFVLTDKRVIAKFGLFSRSTHEQRLSKIESINIDQTWLDRLLNCGTITIRGTGSSATRFGPTPDPLACKRAIETQLNLTDEKA
jgi:uncharacterized membrane protein YdbT with pleckstrin-like domain